MKSVLKVLLWTSFCHTVLSLRDGILCRKIQAPSVYTNRISFQTLQPSFTFTSSFKESEPRRSVLFGGVNDENETDKPGTDELNPITKASWYAVEAYGKVFGAGKGKKKSDSTIDLSKPPYSLEEALKRIEMDNARSYFLSGEVDGMAYDPSCVFADPFVSFSGRDRFIENLANLGSVITDYSAKVLAFDSEDGGALVKTKVMVKLQLNLPWKPILAWPWGVQYTINPDTFLITEHLESWDIEPLEGVKQIFRPSKTTIKKKE